MYLSFNSAESLYIQACTGRPYVLGIPKKRRGFSTLSASVPRPGIEPGWVAPLVFETSASTDSAIWAFCAAKVDVFAELTKCFNCFFAKEVAF